MTGKGSVPFIHEIANPLPPMELVGNQQPITGENVERQFHEGSLLEPAHHAGKQHSGEHLEGALSGQAVMQASPMALEPAWKDNIEAGLTGTTQNLQQQNRFDVLDQTISALLPIEAVLEFQGFPFIPEPENPNSVHADVVVDVGNEVTVAIPVVNQIINNETLADDGTPSYDSNGYDSDGYDSDGYDSNGYDNTGSNSDASDN